MKLREYLLDKLPYFLLLTVAGVLSYVLLIGTGTSRDAALFAVLLYSLMALIALAVDFVRKFMFYRDMDRWLEQNLYQNAPLNLIDPPGFAEGRALYDAVEKLDLARQNALAQNARASGEYREYIESWVHEIKTPLASAKLYLENHPLEDGDRLARELTQMENYITQVLYYARAASLEKDFRIRPVRLEELVRRTLRQNSLSLIEAGFSISQQGLDAVVMADATWMEFILGQLISNAVKYRRQAPQLDFRAEKRTNAVLLRIRDNGLGIPAQDLPRVFEKGFTGANGRKLGKSTGMGLYIVRKLCDKMSIGVEAASMPGESTTITLCFPLGDEYNLTKM